MNRCEAHTIGVPDVGARRWRSLFATRPDFIRTLQKCWHFPVQPRSYEESLVDQIAALFDRKGQGR